MAEKQERIIADRIIAEWNREIETVYGAIAPQLYDRVHLELLNDNGESRTLSQGVQHYEYVLTENYKTDGSDQILINNWTEANRICVRENPPYTPDVIKRLNIIDPKYPYIWWYPYSNNTSILNVMVYASARNLPKESIEDVKAWMLTVGQRCRPDYRIDYGAVNAYIKMAWPAKEPMPVGAIPLRNGNWTTDPRLTWIPGDPWNKPAAPATPKGLLKASDVLIDTRRYPRTTWLDQMLNPACVGFAQSQMAAGMPRLFPGITNATALNLYYRAKELDEIPKSNYDGTTTYGGFMAAIEAGYLIGFEWLKDMDEVQEAHMKTGVIIGIPWYEEMYTPDKWGNVGIGGALAGGHQLWQNANNIEKKGCREANSWNINWGVKGDFWLTWDQLDKLIFQLGGDAARPIYA